MTFLVRVARIFSTIEQKSDKLQSCESCVKNAMNTHFLHIVDRLLTDACNKNFIALVQLRGTFSTKNKAMNTHFLYDSRKMLFIESL
jgi:hypothetical protein